MLYPVFQQSFATEMSEFGKTEKTVSTINDKPQTRKPKLSFAQKQGQETSIAYRENFQATDPIEYKEGLINEILRTPLFKDILRESLNNIDSKNGRKIAETILWQDMETLFSIIGALPEVINFQIYFIEELGIQLSEKIPPQLLQGYIKETLKQIDTERIKNCMNVYGAIILGLLKHSPELEPAVFEFIKGPALSDALSNNINKSLRAINKAEQENPGYLSGVISTIMSKVDKEELDYVSMNILKTILDQKPPIFKMVWNIIKIYVAGLFGRNKN